MAVWDAVPAVGDLHADGGKLLPGRIPEQRARVQGQPRHGGRGGQRECVSLPPDVGYYEQHGDILGNAKRDALAKLLSGGPYLDEVCTTLGTLRERNETCGKCPHFEYCNGGCRAVALALTGDKLGVNPSKCLFWSKDYDRRIAERLPGYDNGTPVLSRTFASSLR